jgi:mono/diheme cytochrome c family protein
MKKTVTFLVTALVAVFITTSAFAAACPQDRKTKAAPDQAADQTAGADAAKGKELYNTSAKPMACKNCHGEAGGGDGKLGAALKPEPRNFACKETMGKITAGQMFWVIKNGSAGTGMVAHEKTLKDNEIWDLVKYIRTELMK